MEFAIKSSDLVAGLSATSSAVRERTTIPILSHALLSSSGSVLGITATDMEFAVETEVAAQTKVGGKATVPLRKLLDLAKLFPPESFVAFKLSKDGWFEILNEKRKYRMPGFDASAFPATPEFSGKLIDLPARAIKRLIDRIAFAVSDSESNYVLNGALMILAPKFVRIVATDGHRMALAETSVAIGVERETKVLIPKRALTELAALSDGAGPEESVKFGASEGHLFFSTKKRSVVARALTGQFPNYEAVLPKDHAFSVTVDSDILTDASKRVGQLAEDRTHAVNLSVSADGAVELSSKSPEYGEASETVDAERKGSKEPLSIGFNNNYLLNFLAAAPPGPLVIRLKDKNSAIDISPATGDVYRYVVMPLAIG